MRRVNCVSVAELTQGEVRREHIALAGFFPWAWDHATGGNAPAGPELRYNFTSWNEHWRFLAPRLIWVRRRWLEVHANMSARGLEPTFQLAHGEHSKALGDEWQGDWKPAPTDLGLSRSRLVETSNVG